MCGGDSERRMVITAVRNSCIVSFTVTEARFAPRLWRMDEA
jgi:hypothetical protein